MNLYRISQTANDDYDTYDSAVVAAQSEEDARAWHPGGYMIVEVPEWRSWTQPENVTVEFLGIAKEGTRRGTICASFNAG